MMPFTATTKTATTTNSYHNSSSSRYLIFLVVALATTTSLIEPSHAFTTTSSSSSTTTSTSTPVKSLTTATFGVRSSTFCLPRPSITTLVAPLFLSSIPNNNEAVFVPPPQNDKDDNEEEEEEEDEDDDNDDDDDGAVLDKVERLGRGASKSKRGKRKSGGGKTSAKKAAALAAAIAATSGPEEVFYEGPPAISETYLPTASILTVVGIIPAAAAWARQAWVRYKITTRRIRVTSGMGGKDMAEIVYPDIVEIRTAKRLFGDGDMVAFLRDGARFEMRNVPNFEAFVEFVLARVDPTVAATYRDKGGNVNSATTTTTSNP